MDRDRILSLERDDLRLLRARQQHIARQRRPILVRQVLLRHVYRDQLAVKAIRVPAAAGQHDGRVRTGSHADENAFLCAPKTTRAD
jgi:hypothetical protein